ncbi:MAG: hypothetical protein P1T08_06400 [Acidimicrobiia bacterium]|nr:hypothetical protein [Acidimicrobiia bacterium]
MTTLRAVQGDGHKESALSDRGAVVSRQQHVVEGQFEVVAAPGLPMGLHLQTSDRSIGQSNGPVGDTVDLPLPVSELRAADGNRAAASQRGELLCGWIGILGYLPI